MMLDLIKTVYGQTQTYTTGGGVPSPLDSHIQTIPQLVDAILKVVVDVGLPIIVLAIVYVGFLFVKARGNKDELTTAKSAFVTVIIGAAIVLGAAVIKGAIETTIHNL